MPDTVHIIGAGVGGLSLGALLTHAGYHVEVYEKSNKTGGRTASMTFRQHILDNGFHIMPFYKKSSIYEVLQKIGITSRLKLAKVDDISFHSDTGFHKYPKGMVDLLQLSLIPFKSRINLLKVLLPMAFASIQKTEEWDDKSLTEVTKKLDNETGSFFEAVCMLAFADTVDHISLGEFARTIIRANPFKGGTSEFAYPDNGGYDSITKILAQYITENQGTIETNHFIKKIIIENSKVVGIITKDDNFINAKCVVVSFPAYDAINQLFDDGAIQKDFVQKISRLDKKTSVVEVHFALKKKIDTRQVVFPVGDSFVTKGIFFISNITPSVSPPGEHLIIAGTPVDSSIVGDSKKIDEIVQNMKTEISSIYPEFKSSLIWERAMAWKLVESVVKEPGMVWKSKTPHQIPGIDGLFFVGDSTVSYGIGTDSAAHSSLLCYPKIDKFLKS